MGIRKTLQSVPPFTVSCANIAFKPAVYAPVLSISFSPLFFLLSPPFTAQVPLEWTVRKAERVIMMNRVNTTDSQQSGDYLIKCAELESLLRKHLSHTERKCISVEAQLQDALLDNRLLRGNVATLTELLAQERERSRSMQCAFESAKRTQDAEVSERQRTLLEQVKACENRARELQEKEALLRDSEVQLGRLRVELKTREEVLAAQRAQLQRSVSTAEQELEEERQRMVAASAEANEQLREAQRASQAAQQQKLDLDKRCLFERECRSLCTAEMRDRTDILHEESSQRASLLLGALRPLWALASATMRTAEVSASDLRRKTRLLELREREVAAKLHCERECLKDDQERFSLEKGVFLLDCQAIVRNLRAALTGTEATATSQEGLAALKRAERILSVAAKQRVLGTDTSERE